MTKAIVLLSMSLLPVWAYPAEYLDGQVQDFELPNDVYCVVYTGPVNGNEYTSDYNSTPSVAMQCDFGRRKYASIDDTEKTTSRGQGD